MLPVLTDGDSVLVRRGRRVRAGDVVVGRFRERPELLVVKRALEEVDGGWLLVSDNPAVEGHGLTRGVADVEGVVRWRYRPWPPAPVERQVPPGS